MTTKPVDNPSIRFPEDLFLGNTSLNSNELWWVARTKSRQEKALAWSLKGLGIDYFLPLVHHPQKNKKRMRVSIVPLFSGYLFFRGDLLTRQNVLRTGRAAQVLEVEDQTTFLQELRQIDQVIAKQPQLELCDFVSKGKKVRIISGPFEGLEGVVKEVKGKARLILQINAIRQAALVEIDLDQVA